MFYEVKTVQDNVPQADGKLKTQKCLFLVEQELFGQAELAALQLSGNADVVAVKRAKIDEVLPLPADTSDMGWYKATVVKIYTNDKGDVTKESKWYLVGMAKSTDEATQMFVDYMRQGLDDFRLDKVERMKYDDVQLTTPV
jgi:hypothetical protein